MSPDAESRILQALQQSESRIMGEVADVKGTLIRVEGRVGALEGACTLRHKQVDADLCNLRTATREISAEDKTDAKMRVAELQAQLKERDAEKRKWLFWGVTTAVGLMLSGGGIVGGLIKLLAK